MRSPHANRERLQRATAPIDPFMRRDAVLHVIGLPTSSFYRLIERGEFPRGVRISARTVGWRRSVVEKFMRAREEGEIVK